MLPAGTGVPHTSSSATAVRSSVQAGGCSRIASLTTAASAATPTPRRPPGCCCRSCRHALGAPPSCPARTASRVMWPISRSRPSFLPASRRSTSGRPGSSPRPWPRHSPRRGASGFPRSFGTLISERPVARASAAAVLPVHGQVLAPAELLQACGEQILDPPQAVLVGGFGADGQQAGRGPHGPLTPVQGDGPLGPGAVHPPYLGRGVAAGVRGWPVAQAAAGHAAHLAGVAAE